MLATSKNVLCPGHNHLLTTGTDEPTLYCPSASEGEESSIPVVSRWLWNDNRTFLEVASMVDSFFFSFFFCAVMCLYFSMIFNLQLKSLQELLTVDSTLVLRRISATLSTIYCYLLCDFSNQNNNNTEGSIYKDWMKPIERVMQERKGKTIQQGSRIHAVIWTGATQNNWQEQYGHCSWACLCIMIFLVTPDVMGLQWNILIWIPEDTMSLSLFFVLFNDAWSQ